MSQPVFPIAGSPEACTNLCRLLREAGFEEHRLAERLGLQRLSLFTEIAASDQALRARLRNSPDTVNVLILLLLFGEVFPRDVVEAVVPRELLEALAEFHCVGLFRENLYVATAMVYPLGHLFLASDRFISPDGQAAEISSDFVYMALQKRTESFIRRMPTGSFGSFLEIGTGCGAAALLAASYSDEVWALDIGRRCIEYTEFNRRLNGISNLTAVAGDLYQPVSGRKFDAIIIHPPHDISPSANFVFSDGGKDGENVLRPTVQGLSQHLASGGIFYSEAMMSDHTDRRLEWRVRDWLGESQAEFDVFVAVNQNVSTEDYAKSALAAIGAGTEAMEPWRALFARLNVSGLLYGHLVIRRRAEERAVVTMRRQIVDSTTWSDLLAVLDREVPLAQPDFTEHSLQASPRATEDFELHIRHKVIQGELNPVSWTIVAERPIPLEVNCPGWAHYLIDLADGAHTGEDIVRHLVDKGIEADRVIDAIRALVSAGVLSV